MIPGITASLRRYAALPKLLDEYPGASLAYSLRKLRSDYAGAAIRVLRTSDNQESDIGFTASGGLDESALQAFVGSSSAAVMLWYDQSGNSRHAQPTSSSNAPLIVESGVINRIGALPCCMFNGLNMFMQFSEFGASSQSLSLFSVANAGAGYGEPSVYISGAIGSAQFRVDGEPSGKCSFSIVRTYQVSLLKSPSTLASGSRRLCSFFTNTTGMGIYVDGSELATSANSPSFTGAMSLLGRNSHPVEGHLNGGAQEFVLYESDKRSNRVGIELNISAFYGA